MRPGVHQRSVTTVYNNKGKVLFFKNSYHYRGELKLKLMNFERIKTMKWVNLLVLSRNTSN